MFFHDVESRSRGGQAGMAPTDPFNDGSTNVIADENNTTEREDILLYIVIAIVVIASVYRRRLFGVSPRASCSPAGRGKASVGTPRAWMGSWVTIASQQMWKKRGEEKGRRRGRGG